MRRTLEHARVTQVGIRSLSTEEAEVLPRLNTTIFYDVSMREDPAWIDAIVESLDADVYVSIDVDGLDPAIMPATGTPEPGGLSWTEITRLLRTTAERGDRRVRFRRAQPDPRHGGAHLPVREAPLQTAHLLLRERPAVATRWV